MIFKSPTQPFCRHCGRAIKKLTNLVVFGAESDHITGYWLYRAAFPKNKAEAQREVNEKIVSISYAGQYWAEKQGHNYVDKASTWDGESYQDQYFCGGTCRQAFAVLMASHGHCTTDYNAAVERHKEKLDASNQDAV